MSLLVLMYHRARAGRLGNAPAMLDAHFACLAARATCVLPGEPLAPGRLNVCLSFDDATYDFYALVVPLLRRHRLRALLAVPTYFIRERSLLSPDSRLALPAEIESPAPHYDAFCTWPELAELSDGGHVTLAAHGCTHRRLDLAGVDLHTEIVAPGTLLSARLGRPVESFVFPYGRFSSNALRLARTHYRHVFRIGGASNPGWEQTLLYRVAADDLPSPSAPLTPTRLLGYRLRSSWNRLRRR